MTTLDDLPFLVPDGPDAPRPGAAPARKCKHPKSARVPCYRTPEVPVIDGKATLSDGSVVTAPPHVRVVVEPVLALECGRCGKLLDLTTSRRGRNSRKRGLSIQREVAAALEMEHIPGNGPADARDPRFVAEVKSGPGWYSVRVEAELDNLPTTGDRLPIFVAASTPGPGHGRRRTYVQVSLGDLVKMVGPHVQVAMWAPEWVALKHITEGGTE